MKRIIILIFLSFTILSTSALANETYTIGIPYLNAEKGITPKIEALISEMYSRANLSIKFKYFPGLRDLISANNGITDGSGVRTLQAIAQYSNLTNITTPVAVANFSSFSKNKKNIITTPKDLHKLTVGVVRGEITPCNIAHKYAKKAHIVNSYESLLGLLERGRVDAIIMERTLARKLFTKKNAKGIIESEPLVSRKLYHIINNKHAHFLKPKLDKSLRGMLLDGTAKKLFGQYEDIIFSTPPLPPKKSRTTQTTPQ
ncbi:ABC transporter substrate-binding protein [Desulfovibrio sp. JC022]|uniref:substrate-binding periplasmic protein n=1 Tax=Desulfovibrio sp. JC022 TaxID=2593642 RepID=UPI0013D6057D|nr:transporter substrate-binding domain-containing protein [Desulfovibrio sp. JC022]NDV24528.1 transporter substrate-binding domain-containing protein [Desulfovibrio sp. JC022]